MTSDCDRTLALQGGVFGWPVLQKVETSVDRSKMALPPGSQLSHDSLNLRHFPVFKKRMAKSDLVTSRCACQTLTEVAKTHSASSTTTTLKRLRHTRDLELQPGPLDLHLNDTRWLCWVWNTLVGTEMENGQILEGTRLGLWSYLHVRVREVALKSKHRKIRIVLLRRPGRAFSHFN
ncbi:hypothetical protein CONLIGDRAFT_245566 [Coniochaeta ligniaria NRRL 30616]|uniref:Uncharacterized protein n=1 Tax=Coniochaeta ligniaria NRRL 30616 TaxID=1408157 RepID=A0A1J7JPP3_9PEZI|nr:hypothetical protein CONLIGDRAFT_245566 [Coniochaeta ligniaria NRRL 30616]